jgi:dihydrodipicolinate reductase
MGFVNGAILAAEWIVNKKGCFSMSDVLKIK